MNTADTTLEMPRVATRSRRSRRRTAVLATAVVLLMAAVLAVVAVPSSSPGTPSMQEAEAAARSPQGAHSGSTRPGSAADVDGEALDATTTTGDAGPIADGASSAQPSGAPDAGDGPAAPAPAAPQLVVDTDIYAEPGANGVLFRIGNSGGAPLHWTVPHGDGPVNPVQPEVGTITPGGTQIVSFELGHPLQSDTVFSLTVESDGGTADVKVHLDALDPVFEIVGGTWNIRNGNTFLVSYTDMDLGLTLKNVGAQPLHIEPQLVDGLAMIGGPWTLEPGEEAHLHLVLCNAAYSGGIPDFHDRDFHIHTDGWQGTLDFMVRFTLAPGQVALPC